MSHRNQAPEQQRGIGRDIVTCTWRAVVPRRCFRSAAGSEGIRQRGEEGGLGMLFSSPVSWPIRGPEVITFAPWSACPQYPALVERCGACRSTGWPPRWHRAGRLVQFALDEVETAQIQREAHQAEEHRHQTRPDSWREGVRGAERRLAVMLLYCFGICWPRGPTNSGSLTLSGWCSCRLSLFAPGGMPAGRTWRSNRAVWLFRPPSAA